MRGGGVSHSCSARAAWNFGPIALARRRPITDATCSLCSRDDASGFGKTLARPVVGKCSLQVRVVDGPPLATILVRGENPFGNLAPVPPRSVADLDDDIIAADCRVLEPHAAGHFSTA